MSSPNETLSDNETEEDVHEKEENILQLVANNDEDGAEEIPNSFYGSPGAYVSTSHDKTVIQENEKVQKEKEKKSPKQPVVNSESVEPLDLNNVTTLGYSTHNVSGDLDDDFRGFGTPDVGRMVVLRQSSRLDAAAEKARDHNQSLVERQAAPGFRHEDEGDMDDESPYLANVNGGGESSHETRMDINNANNTNNTNNTNNSFIIHEEFEQMYDLPIAISAELITNETQDKDKSLIITNAILIPEPKSIRKSVMLSISAVIILVVAGIVTAVVMTLPEKSQHLEQSTSKPRPNATYGELEFRPIGSTIFGRTASDGIGQSVSLATNARIVAVGAPGSSNSTTGDAYVTVYSLVKTNMIFVTNITGSAPYDGTGYSVSVNGNGTFVAVGSPFINPPDSYSGSFQKGPGSVSVYEIDIDNGQHIRRGSIITGSDPGDEFGWIVALSASGRLVAVASRSKCNIQVFQFSTNISDWIEYGQPVNCSTSAKINSTINEFALSMSRDGSTIILGEPQIDMVSVYKYNTSSLLWQKVGANIKGNTTNEKFGASVATNFDGDRLVCCSPGYKMKGYTHGRCSSFQYNGINDEWIKFAKDVYGKADNILFGASVAMSDPGKTIAIGAVDGTFPDGGEKDFGNTTVYEFNDDEKAWNPMSISPIAKSASAVAMSIIGKNIITVAIGNPQALPTFGVRLYQNFWTERPGVPVLINFGSYDGNQLFNWSLDRLDGDVTGPLQYFRNEYETNFTIEFVVPAEGVYRVTSETVFVVSLKVDDRFVETRSNNLKQMLFLARFNDVENDSSLRRGTSFVDLSIDFDDYPENLYWVLVAEESSDRQRTILGWGPDAKYDGGAYDPTKETENKRIDTSVVTPNTYVSLILSDQARDGFGGSIFLKNASNGNVLINVTSNTWKERYYNCFLLYSDCNCCEGEEMAI